MRKLIALATMLAMMMALAAPASAEPEEKVTICHKDKNTLSVGAAAVPAHLAHGDTLGPCKDGGGNGPNEPGDNGDGDGRNDGKDNDGDGLVDEFGELLDLLEDFGAFDGMEQEAESGDISQNFTVTNTGDNSNQCVGISGNANTGNLQSQNGTSLSGGGIDEFESEGGDNSLTVGGDSVTTCDQSVNQAAASGAYYYY